jgi:ABC-type enterochelin transport system substrate-binding protein
MPLRRRPRGHYQDEYWEPTERTSLADIYDNTAEAEKLLTSIDNHLGKIEDYLSDLTQALTQPAPRVGQVGR